MRTYLMNIAGAVIITVFAEVLLPEKWNKYIKIITGLIIISAIASPIGDRIDFNLSQFFNENEEFRLEGEDLSKRMVTDELTNMINTDCQTRLLEEFGIDAEIESVVEVNENNEIVGVKQINILSKNVTQDAVKRLEEVYAPQEVRINGD